MRRKSLMEKWIDYIDSFDNIYWKIFLWVFITPIVSFLWVFGTIAVILLVVVTLGAFVSKDWAPR